jgi:putative membrane protein
MYLILAEAIAPWVRIPDLGNIGFTLVFVLFALLHCATQEGWKRTGIFFAVSAVVSYVMEDLGVQTGLVFGKYHYSDLLGTKLGHVPILIPLAWFMMIYPSWMVARAVLAGISLRNIPAITAVALLASFVMTGWDVVMDPAMAAAGNWVWENGGAYFGVPRHNYLGWLLTTFLVYWITGFLWRSVRGRHNSNSATPVFDALPVIVYAYFSVRYVAANRFPALQLIAMFSMGVPALAAVIQLLLNRPSANTSTAD